MTIREFVKRQRHGYIPSTAGTALRAFENDILPQEYFIFRSISVRSLDQKPYDLDEIDKVLKREDNSYLTNQFLVRIFNELVHDRDQERALFAAEGINHIESFYNERREELINELKEHDSDTVRSRLAHLYYEIAMINEDHPAIRNFYLKEAYDYLKSFLDQKRISKSDLDILIKILIVFGLFDQAKTILLNTRVHQEPFFMWLQAEISYYQRNYSETARIMKELESESDTEKSKIISYWLNKKQGVVYENMPLY